MSEQPQSYAFPQRAPIFTAVVVVAGILLFGVFVGKFYRAAAPLNPRGNVNPADIAEDQRWKLTTEGRAAVLAKIQQDVAHGNTYGWVDQKAGIARLPLDRAADLIVREHAKK
jgi:hypothetical protein